MILLVLLTTILHVGSTEPPSYVSKPFRPSQPYPLIDRIQSPIPAKHFGPPKPVYGVPNRPDDSAEPTTPPNNFRAVPSKLNSPQSSQSVISLVFPSQQMSAQQFNQLWQQQLPSSYTNQQFRPELKLQKFVSTNSLHGQLLPNPIQAHSFKENRATGQYIQVPLRFQELPFRNFNVEIQRSQEFQLRGVGTTNSPPKNFNINNQHSINVQNPSLFNINAFPVQKPGMNNKQIQPTSNLGIFMNKKPFANNKIITAKRARGEEVTAAPSRHYLRPEPTTPRTVVPSTKKRRPSTTAASKTENNPIGRGPNVAISNSFAGRLFLLQSDGHLEPVILKRANPNDPDVTDMNNISPSELTQPFFNPGSLPIPK